MKILVLDNYDSFTFNLVHMVEKVSNCDVTVKRNDAIQLSEFSQYDKIILSPGPGLPEESGIMLDFIRHYYQQKSILGVCLGHQALAVALGGSLQNLPTVLHGVSNFTTIIADDKIFNNLPKVLKTGHYHSWIVDIETLPSGFITTAVDENNNTMAMRHTQFDLCGVQFHPESVLTEHGELLLKNWLQN